jgi:hypothetical protein
MFDHTSVPWRRIGRGIPKNEIGAANRAPICFSFRVASSQVMIADQGSKSLVSCQPLPGSLRSSARIVCVRCVVQRRSIGEVDVQKVQMVALGLPAST